MPRLHLVNVLLKEIPVQDSAYAHKQVGVNALALENGIYVRALATKFAGEPADAAFLRTQFLLYESSDVYHDKILSIMIRTSTRESQKSQYETC